MEGEQLRWKKAILSSIMQKSEMYPMQSILRTVPGPICSLPHKSSGMNRIIFEHAITVPRDMPSLDDKEAFMKEQVSVPYPVFRRNERKTPIPRTPMNIRPVLDLTAEHLIA